LDDRQQRRLRLVSLRHAGQQRRAGVQTETWAAADANGARICTYHVDVQGVPAKVSGTLTLSAAGTGTKQDIESDMKVSIPLLGGKLEKLMVDTAKSDIDQQVNFTLAELAG